MFHFEAPVYQLGELYRQGELEDCSARRAAWLDCLALRTRAWAAGAQVRNNAEGLAGRGEGRDKGRGEGLLGWRLDGRRPSRWGPSGQTALIPPLLLRERGAD